MTIISKIREIAARHALERQLNAEMSALSDSELMDLNLSRAKLAELSHAQAWSKHI
ncbi:MAG: hypothetical protein AAGF27_04745 [Pseudomonadota bacterium]